MISDEIADEKEKTWETVLFLLVLKSPMKLGIKVKESLGWILGFDFLRCSFPRKERAIIKCLLSLRALGIVLLLLILYISVSSHCWNILREQISSFQTFRCWNAKICRDQCMVANFLSCQVGTNERTNASHFKHHFVKEGIASCQKKV